MLWTFLHLRILLFTSATELVTANDKCRTEWNIQGMALKRSVFIRWSVEAPHLCDAKCGREISCQSYNYNREFKICELNNRTKEARPDNFISAPKWSYVRRLNGRAPLGSIPELPASSCHEIKASEGKDAISSRYWLDLTGDKRAVMIYCDMTNEDVDECVAEKQNCSANAVCSNVNRSYTCECKTGYSGNGWTCKDINECATGTHDCSVDDVCNNIKGSYNCVCKPAYYGDGITCQDFDECSTGKHSCSADAFCNNIKGSYNCTCKLGYFGDGRTCKVTISSCKEAYERKILSGSGVVTLHIGSIPTSVYCLVGDVECGNGTWTLVMMVADGSKRTFHYDSHYWSNKIEYNLPGGETGFDTMETRLPTYWNTSFSKICLAMKIDQQLRFIVISMEADSLYSLIADGQYRPTSLSRDTWRSLIGPKASSQIYCNREGFNIYSLKSFWEFKAARARIGFVTNNTYNCDDVDTRIGFGTGGPYDDNNPCGIVAYKSGFDNGSKFIKAMGYILVQ